MIGGFGLGVGAADGLVSSSSSDGGGVGNDIGNSVGDDVVHSCMCPPTTAPRLQRHIRWLDAVVKRTSRQRDRTENCSHDRQRNATKEYATYPRAMAIAVVCDDNPFAINGRQHQQRVCPHTLDCRSRQPSCTFPPFVHQRASATMVARVLPCQYHQWYTCTTVLEYHGRVSGWAVPP